MAITFELTDTFSGEANYSWVRRGEYQGEGTHTSEASILRQAKAWAGLNGVRCRKEEIGGTLTALYPQGRNLVLFIDYGC